MEMYLIRKAYLGTGTSDIHPVVFSNKDMADMYCEEHSNARKYLEVESVQGTLVTGNHVLVKGAVYQYDTTSKRDLVRSRALGKLSETEINMLGIILTDAERKLRYRKE